MTYSREEDLFVLENLHICTTCPKPLKYVYCYPQHSASFADQTSPLPDLSMRLQGISKALIVNLRHVLHSSFDRVFFVLLR